MKKRTQSSLVFAGLVVCSLGSLKTFAATTPATYNSNGTIAFASGGADITPPVDPDDPKRPVDPVDPPSPGTPGPLSIDFASKWKFGAQEVTAQDTTYYAHPEVLKDGGTRQLYAQVTDARGSFAGWNLSLTQSGQFTDASGNELKGASLSFTGAGATKSTSATPASLVSSDFTLIPGTIQTVMTAVADEGTGTNVYSFGSGSDYDTTATTDEAVASKGPVQLSVVGGSMRSESYTSDLVWTLSDTPV